MLPIYIGAYIFLLAVLWGFFLLARHHSYKFKHYSTNIVPVTNFLFFFLIICSILGFVLVFMLGGGEGRIELRQDSQTPVIETYY